MLVPTHVVHRFRGTLSTDSDPCRPPGCFAIPTRPGRQRAAGEPVEPDVNRTYHDLARLSEARETIAPPLAALNERPFQKTEGSRRSLFEDLDRPALKPLPADPYEYAEQRGARVNIDYHIQADIVRIRTGVSSLSVGLVRHWVREQVSLLLMRNRKDPDDRPRVGSLPVPSECCAEEKMQVSLEKLVEVFLLHLRESLALVSPSDLLYPWPPKQKFPSFPPVVRGLDVVDALDLAGRPVGLGALVAGVLGERARDPIVEPVLLPFFQSTERHRIETHPGPFSRNPAVHTVSPYVFESSG